MSARAWMLLLATAALVAVMLHKRDEPLAEHPYPTVTGESPFVVAGIRAGMQYSTLDTRSIAPDAPASRSRVMVGAFRDKRGTRMLSPLGLLVPLEVLVDSIEDRVIGIRFGPLTEDPAFVTQMEQVAAEWDAITGGVRETSLDGAIRPASRSATWRSADTLWRASIDYNWANRPIGFRMIETTGYERTYRRHIALWAKEHGREP